MGRYCGDTYETFEERHPPYPFDYLSHAEAIRKRDEFNARDGKTRGDKHAWEISRSSIFYRVARWTTQPYILADPEQAEPIPDEVQL